MEVSDYTHWVLGAAGGEKPRAHSESIEPFDDPFIEPKKPQQVLRPFKIWCPVSESNQGHEDFQSSALPTELTGRLEKNYTHRERRVLKRLKSSSSRVIR